MEAKQISRARTLRPLSAPQRGTLNEEQRGTKTRERKNKGGEGKGKKE